MSECLCGQQRLWITVENPVDKPVSEEQSFPPHAPPFKLKDKDFIFASEMLEALASAFDLLAARVDALEYLLDELLGLIQAPLTQDERVSRIRQITEQLKGPGPPTSK